MIHKNLIKSINRRHSMKFAFVTFKQILDTGTDCGSCQHTTRSLSSTSTPHVDRTTSL